MLSTTSKIVCEYYAIYRDTLNPRKNIYYFMSVLRRTNFNIKIATGIHFVRAHALCVRLHTAISMAYYHVK